LARLVAQFAETLPPQTPDPQGVALGIYATLVGALQLAPAVPSKAQSDRILSAGAEAARALARAAPLGRLGRPLAGMNDRLSAVVTGAAWRAPRPPARPCWGGA
jgi:hypothetical protein